MKKTVFFVGLLTLACAFVFAQNLSDADTKAVLKAWSDWDDAYVKKDPTIVEKLLTADYLGIDEDGTVTSKADEINLIKTGDYVVFSVEHIDPPKTRFYGSTAIVTTHSKVKQQYKGQAATITARATTVCVKQGSDWKIVSWHASKASE